MALALGTAGMAVSYADNTTATTTTPPPAGGEGFHHESILTPDEKAELKKDRDQVFANNPALKTEEATLKQKHESLKSQGENGSESDRQALHQEMRDFHQKMNAAIVALDPQAAPILARLEAAHKDWHHE